MNSKRSKSADSSMPLVIWRNPIITSYYFVCECIHFAGQFIRWTFLHKWLCITMAVITLLSYLLTFVSGPHEPYLQLLRSEMSFVIYWVVLGVLSSVGLGTGLHTFLLYLGPHIAAVTVAAYECNSLDFPSPPYPDSIVCPDDAVPSSSTSISVWSIMSKVRFEAFLWGMGTAIGELPPYFVARAHRMAGQSEEELSRVMSKDSDKSLTMKFKSVLISFVTKVGFFGILMCASIPNPLFDLAGITCGYSLIPFWTFFGATLIGKAIVKMHIQKLFVIIAFNENYVEHFVMGSRNVPFIGEHLHQPLREFLLKQKQSLHRSSQSSVKETSIISLSFIFEKLVMAMIVYFLISIINSMAQNHQTRLNDCQQKNKQLRHSDYVNHFNDNNSDKKQSKRRKKK